MNNLTLATPTSSPRRAKKRSGPIHDDIDDLIMRKRIRRANAGADSSDSESEESPTSCELPVLSQNEGGDASNLVSGASIDAPYISSAYKSPFMNRIRPRTLSRASSYSSFSLPGPTSPGPMTPPSLLPYDNDPTIARGMALMRSASISSVDTPRSVIISEFSAKTNLRNLKTSIDFSPPDTTAPHHAPIVWMPDNFLYFTRGNKVHFKNLAAATTAEVGSLCKLQPTHGNLRVMVGGVENQANEKLLALGTSTGCVQIWDVQARKMTMSWMMKEVPAMAWNGPVLTVGTEKGIFRHFDTRIKPQVKMKELAKKVTRHQAQLTQISFNNEGKLYATADSAGTILCWDTRDPKRPLDVGEIVQRRKKMQHFGSVSALTWAPWSARLLASGSTSPKGNGDICLWDINASGLDRVRSDMTSAGRIRTNCQVTSLHFSLQCKELLSTHGKGPESVSSETTFEEYPYSTHGRFPVECAGSVAVHSTHTLETIKTENIAGCGVAGSALNVAGTKVVFAVPGESVLKVWDAWGKRSARKHLSMQSVIR